MPTATSRGLPARYSIPLFTIAAVIFLSVLFYFLRIAFAENGTALGPGPSRPSSAAQEPQNVGVGGGPPPAVREQLSELHARIASHPRDDVALVQLADLYLAAQKYAQAMPLYRRALAVNPTNVAAQAGLEEAKAATRQEHTP